ncbi:MAG: hypothetical protein NTY04_01610 [Candidatus Staskawiczbacteria bacterium]|nr:hypothetical protein [Candidatus Staskawiczbacteria bacterium]
MNIAKKSKDFLIKLQDLSDTKKKIILWTVVIIIGLFMGFFWVKEAKTSFLNISKSIQNTKMPEINTSNMPTVDLQKLQNQNIK